MIFIQVIIVFLILGAYLKWLNDYGKPKNQKKEKRKADLKNALGDFRNQFDIRK